MTVAVAGREPPDYLRQLAALWVTVLRGELGRGEVGRNNRGPDVDRFRRGRGWGAWCAALLAYGIEEAAERMGWRCPVARTHWARGFAARVARVGCWVDLDADVIRLGDVLLWRRGAAGHVALASRTASWADEERRIAIIEGNAGPFPARVRERDLVIGEWSPKLLGVARLYVGP